MSENSKKVSYEPYKGVRDFYPADWAFEKWLFEKMRKVVESYGYVEYNASPLEPFELYLAKTGEEIVSEQAYTFTDRGNRQVTLRPEMTPTVARMLAARKRELSFPLRWYSIPNIFRYEQPQRGRLREHYQLNVDLFGLKGIEAEVEIISIAYNIMKALGAKDEDFEIKVNSRKLLEETYKPILKKPEDWPKVLRLLDKKAKISNEEFEKEGDKLFSRRFNEDDTSPKTNPELTRITQILAQNNIKVVFDRLLVRGFDYYTDIVFEVFDKSRENKRSLFGGGRYDELLNIFDEETVPAVGFGMGDVTAHDFLETHELIPTLSSSTKLYVCVIDEANVDFGEKTAAALRAAGINTALDFTYRKVGNQIKSADKQKIPYVIVIGEEETKLNTFNLKELVTGNEEKMTLEQIIAKLSSPA